MRIDVVAIGHLDGRLDGSLSCVLFSPWVGLKWERDPDEKRHITGGGSL